VRQPPAILQSFVEPFLTLLREAVVEAREKGLGQEHIDSLLDAAKEIAHESPYGIDKQWLLAQIAAAAAEPLGRLH
jgi:hypothetical protein